MCSRKMCMMRKEFVYIFLCFSFIVFSSFIVSANIFSDIWNKVTGKVVDSSEEISFNENEVSDNSLNDEEISNFLLNADRDSKLELIFLREVSGNKFSGLLVAESDSKLEEKFLREISYPMRVESELTTNDLAIAVGDNGVKGHEQAINRAVKERSSKSKGNDGGRYSKLNDWFIGLFD